MMKNLNNICCTTYVGMDGEADYWMDGGDDVGDVDDVKPKVMLYDSLSEEKRKPRSSRPHRPAKNPDAPLKEGGELETGEKSGIRPRIFPRIYDRPPRLTHTHTSNTTYTNYIVIVRITHEGTK